MNGVTLNGRGIESRPRGVECHRLGIRQGTLLLPLLKILGQRIRHDPTGNCSAEMPVPGKVGTKPGQDTENKRTTVDESHDDRDGEWDESFFQKAGQDQEGYQPENQATSPNVGCRPSKEP